MLKEEIMKALGISENTLTKKFSRAQDLAEKKGYYLEKTGRGKKTLYSLEQIAARAKSMFEEKGEEIEMDKDILNLNQWELSVLLGTVLAPMRVFRGSKKAFAEYIGVSYQNKNVKAIDEALESLQEKGYILKTVDKDVSIIAIKRQLERELKLKRNMVSESQTIAAKHGIREWQNVLRVWLAIQFLHKNPDTKITAKQLCKLTGIKTQSTVNKCLKALDEHNVLKSQKIYLETYCVGRTVNLNVFKN